MKQILTAALLAFAAAYCGAAMAQKDEAQPGAEAREIWRDAAAEIEGAKSFSATASLAYDVVQPSGRKLQFGAEYQIKAVRPNKFYAGITSDDGRENQLYYDGQNITLVNINEKLYAQFPHEGSIESAVDVVLNELDAVMPLSVLVRGNLRAALEARFPYNAYVGRHGASGMDADHLLMSNDYVDLQLWIDDSNAPRVRKAVITYKTEDAAPQYAAVFSDWKLNKKIKDSEFSFDPSDGFDEIEFLEAQN